MKGFVVRCAVVAAGLSCAFAASAVDLGDYLRRDPFGDLQLSPTGEYVAATVPLEDRTGLAIVRVSDMSIRGLFKPSRHNHAGAVRWVNNERVVVALQQKLGSRDQPYNTGELYGLNADGRAGELLVGYRVGDTTSGQRKKAEAVAAFMVDTLPEDNNHMLVTIWPFTSDEPTTRLDRMDVRDGHRVMVARSPVKRGHFHTDNSGAVRMVVGAGQDNASKLYYRVGRDWKLINDELATKVVQTPIGFSEDNQIAYLQVEQRNGPDAIVAWNPETDERRVVFQDKVADPRTILFRNGTFIPVGVMVMDGRMRTEFFEADAPERRMYRSLEKAFGGAVLVTSATRDGKKVLIQSWGGSNPGDFYVVDTATMQARHLTSHSDWINPADAAVVEPFTMSARDGLQLHGYLTRPKDSTGALPMVVMPHGGPIGVHDSWSYDREAQMLAKAGYAVLQVNFRGSSNYGRRHTALGSQEWGKAMQDDVTDATRWAIAQGHAQKERICIHGASYGGYAAMMGAAREPGLYQCASGYVGVYDLPLMFTRGDIQDSESGLTYLREWLGDPKELAEVSPVNLADRIKIPVLLAAGGEDERAPQKHTERMAAALKKAGTPVETLYYKSEGHGFYTEEHQREYYTKLLAFLSRSLGGATAGATPGATAQPTKGKAAAGR